MLDDEAEEKRARWTFNLVVFFLLFPFAIDLSIMGWGILPVGVGICLIAWRVWKTPGITRPISSHTGPRLRRFLQNLAIALGPLGIMLFSVNDFPINLYSTEKGFPFAIRLPDPNCFGPSGQCYAYDPVLVALSYLFWVGLSFGTLTLAGWVRSRSI